MLDNAIKYAEPLKQLFINTWYDEKYKYYNYRCYCNIPEFEASTLNGHDFVSLNQAGKIVGAIGYTVLRDTESVCGLGIVNFIDESNIENRIIFGRDVLQAIRDIFEKYNFRKLSFCVVIGNPIENTYDKLCAKYGGRIIGIEKKEAKLWDNLYYDVKRYEILREDYVRKRDKM